MVPSAAATCCKRSVSDKKDFFPNSWASHSRSQLSRACVPAGARRPHGQMERKKCKAKRREKAPCMRVGHAVRGSHHTVGTLSTAHTCSNAAGSNCCMVGELKKCPCERVRAVDSPPRDTQVAQLAWRPKQQRKKSATVTSELLQRLGRRLAPRQAPLLGVVRLARVKFVPVGPTTTRRPRRHPATAML